MSVVRGAVWFAEIPTVGDKPVLIVSWQPVHEGLGAAVVARITSVEKKRTLPTAVFLPSGEAGLERDGYVLCHDLFTIDVGLLRRYCGVIAPVKLIEVDAALKRALDLL